MEDALKSFIIVERGNGWAVKTETKWHDAWMQWMRPASASECSDDADAS